jgi:hypothetical protein
MHYCEYSRRAVSQAFKARGIASIQGAHLATKIVPNVLLEQLSSAKLKQSDRATKTRCHYALAIVCKRHVRDWFVQLICVQLCIRDNTQSAALVYKYLALPQIICTNASVY